jgi:iron-sulfur cluster repair protein YtfE (RIC family)
MKLSELSVSRDLTYAHASLLEDLHHLEQAVLPPSREGEAELHARLLWTRNHITSHFRFEEENGYMDAVRKREPHLVRAIDQLAAEHRQLSQDLDELVELTQTGDGVGAALRQKVQAWVERVEAHEHRENDLVQNAFNQDIDAEE